MTVTLKIEKEAKSEVEVEVRVYEATCRECGESLRFDANADSDGDIYVQVEPCAVCLQKEARAGYAEGQKDAEDPDSVRV